MYDARSVANEFIELARAAGNPLTNMQIQKLVYIAHGYSRAILHRPLIRQRVEAWRYGPVIKDLYNDLREYGAGLVTKPIEKVPKEVLSETDKALVQTVLNAYGKFSGPQLSTMTHQKGTPWADVYDPESQFHDTDIPDHLIEKYYSKLLEERGGITPLGPELNTPTISGVIR
jgi:uncharacterized phage-associated protein